mmetsp:Transcript_1446/g.3004  ORF Transcript_1446/g.3004 Transcript_1446/m.3004 type:complete len:283 (-) Transcript_1446:191-1039(-)
MKNQAGRQALQLPCRERKRIHSRTQYEFPSPFGGLFGVPFASFYLPSSAFSTSICLSPPIHCLSFPEFSNSQQTLSLLLRVLLLLLLRNRLPLSTPRRLFARTAGLHSLQPTLRQTLSRSTLLHRIRAILHTPATHTVPPVRDVDARHLSVEACRVGVGIGVTLSSPDSGSLFGCRLVQRNLNVGGDLKRFRLCREGGLRPRLVFLGEQSPVVGTGGSSHPSIDRSSDRPSDRPGKDGSGTRTRIDRACRSGVARRGVPSAWRRVYRCPVGRSGTIGRRRTA